MGLAPGSVPSGAALAPDDRPLRPATGVPFATHVACVVAEGAIALTAAPGVARTIRLPDMAPLFDRRPPGLFRIQGAALANAGLLRDDAGWRAVVLPSLGDLAADLGPGPVAIRADGRRVAVVHEGALFEIELPGAATAQVQTPGTPGAVAYAVDGTLLASLGAGFAGEEGSPIVDLVAAAAVPRALARHEDGTFSVWDTATRERTASWSSPLDGAAETGLSVDGALATLCRADGESPAACVVRVDDGAVTRWIDGACTIALHPDGHRMLVGGQWGALWLEPPREVSAS
jgi:hypothetical protein